MVRGRDGCHPFNTFTEDAPRPLAKRSHTLVNSEKPPPAARFYTIVNDLIVNSQDGRSPLLVAEVNPNQEWNKTIKHNQQIQHNHFRKDWQRRVRTHFDQPGRKSRRRNARITKAAAVAPRPVDKLKPIVRCPSIKYNRRVRAGRGFSLVELKEAGIPRKFAATIGISVDPRRANLSVESLTTNVARLKAYRERLILFPRKSGQHKKNDATKEEIAAHEKGEQKVASKTHHTLPIINQAREEAIGEVKKSDMPKGEEAAYRKLRDARSEARLVGVREKRAKTKQEEAAAAKK